MGSHSQYLKAALASQLNIVLLAACGLFGLVAWTPLPLFIGIAGEAVWLGVAPLLPAFRRAADKRAEKYRRIDAEDATARLLASVPSSSRARFERMAATFRKIRAAHANANAADRILLEQPIARADEMLGKYASLLSASAALDEALSVSSSGDLEQRLSDANAAIENADDRLRAVQEKRRDILLQRIEKVREAEGNAQLLHAQLDSFDDLAGLLRDQTLALRDPSDVTRQIDTLLTEIESSARAYDELRDGLATFDKDLAKTGGE